VQAACDQAKYAAAYLSGAQAPSHPDTEKTIDELHAARDLPRYLQSVQESSSPVPPTGRCRRRGCKQVVRGSDYPDRGRDPNF